MLICNIFFLIFYTLCHLLESSHGGNTNWMPKYAGKQYVLRHHFVGTQKLGTQFE